MEDLRAARSYNDIVVVLSRIKTSASSLKSKAVRRASGQSSKVSVDMSGNGEFSVDSDLISSALSDMRNLLCFSYELQFSRTLSDIIPSDTKLDKFVKLVNAADQEVTRARNAVLKLLNKLGSAVEPSVLSKYASYVQKLLNGILDFSKFTSFVIPNNESQISFTRYIVLHNVHTTNHYILPQLIIAIHARNNLDGTFSYSVSFPSEVEEDASRIRIVKKNDLLSAIREYLNTNPESIALKELDDSSRRNIETLDNVHAVYLDGNVLNVELQSGVTGSDINALLTRLLKVAHAALGVEDPRTDIIHRITVTDKGNKAVQLSLSDRNFFDTKALNGLRRMLSLDRKTFGMIKKALGEENAR